MIFDARALRSGGRIKTDLCVVGSGAGGSMVAMVAAEAGMRVVVLEAGEYIETREMNQREESMLPRLFVEAGAQTSIDRTIKIHQGRGVGGSTLHNLNLCKRIPESILKQWHHHQPLEHLDLSRWDTLYSEVETLLSVSDIPPQTWNRHNRLLEKACKALGWKGGGLRHNRTGCVGSGYCELGCAYNAKNNAIKVLLPRAIRHGAQIIANACAIEVIADHGHVRIVNVTISDPVTRQYDGHIEIEARCVCIAGSATGSPALLQRSSSIDSSLGVGKTLRIHPAVFAAGDFDDPVRAWQGAPQTFECTEHLNLDHEEGHRSWIIPAFAHPAGAATMFPGYGAVHSDWIERYDHLAVFSAMLHEQSHGVVAKRGAAGWSIDYQLSPIDKKELGFGLWACAKLLFAAGARRIVFPMETPIVIERESDLHPWEKFTIVPGSIDISAVHPMASIPMSDDPKNSFVNSQGKAHRVEGLWVADGSLFPTSIGGPPQLSIYALGLHVGRSIIANG